MDTVCFGTGLKEYLVIAKSHHVLRSTTKYEKMTGSIGFLACASACRLETLHQHHSYKFWSIEGGYRKGGAETHSDKKDDIIGAFGKIAFCVILHEVKDIKPIEILDSSLRSEW